MSQEDGVSVSPMNEVFHMGDSILLNCTSHGGSGNKSFQWVKNGNILSNKSLLNLTNITGGNNGGLYNCTVCNNNNNMEGCVSAYTTVFVEPTIILHPVKSFNTTVSTVVELMCSADSFPPATYQWSHLGGFSDSVVGEDSSVLVFNMTVYEDQGYYFCNATSNNVTVSSTTTLLTGKRIMYACILIL